MNKAVYTRDVPPDRCDALQLLLGEAEKDHIKVMVVGGTDSGKTTLLTFLMNEFIARGLSVTVVDSDVGQKSILPPATISLGVPRGPISSPSELEGVLHYFIGTTSPGQYAGEMALGVAKLAEIASKTADVTLIDTTGFVSGVGLEMKRLKVELVRPDFLILLEREGELELLARSVGHLTRVIRLSVSDKVREYSREERREVRKEKWKRYFESSSILEVDLRRITPTGTSMFQGRGLSGGEKSLLSEVFGWIVFAGWKSDRYVVVKADTGDFRLPRRPSLHAIDFEKLSNLLVGFINAEGFCEGLGILKWLRFSEMKAEVLTPLSEEALENVVELRFGRIRVLESGDELGLLRREEL
ncbi:MAG: polyhydroxyalkanoate depolymerase [Thermococcus sp.]|nr:polyhydroxyalkanoate depolymerase [Thermococcus sp.]